MPRSASSLQVARSLLSTVLIAASLTACDPRQTTVSTTTQTTEPPIQSAPSPIASPSPIAEVPKSDAVAPQPSNSPAPPSSVVQSPAPQPDKPNLLQPDEVAVVPDAPLPTPEGMRLGEIEYRAAANTADAALEAAIVSIMAGDSSDKSLLASTRYTYSRVDLNEDGTPETLVYLMGSYTCGSGGCTMLILQSDRQSYELVSEMTLVNPPIVIAEDRTAGWKDLMVYVEGGGVTPHYARLQFDGNQYPSNPSIAPTVGSDIPLSGTAILTEKMSSDSGIKLKL